MQCHVNGKTDIKQDVICMAADGTGAKPTWQPAFGVNVANMFTVDIANSINSINSLNARVSELEARLNDLTN